MYCEWASLQGEIQCDKANQSVLHKFPETVGRDVAFTVVKSIAQNLSVVSNSCEPSHLTYIYEPVMFTIKRRSCRGRDHMWFSPGLPGFLQQYRIKTNLVTSIVHLTSLSEVRWLGSQLLLTTLRFWAIRKPPTCSNEGNNLLDFYCLMHLISDNRGLVCEVHYKRETSSTVLNTVLEVIYLYLAMYMYCGLILKHYNIIILPVCFYLVIFYVLTYFTKFLF
jgi:hypothetical protein